MALFQIVPDCSKSPLGVPSGFRFQKVSGIDSKKAAFELRDSGAAFGVIAKIKLI